MKLNAFPRRALAGSTLTVTLVISGLMGLVLLTYLTLLSGENKATARSQAWNSCIAIAEAGIEEAMSHLNVNGVTNGNLVSNGWTQQGTRYYLRRALDDCYFEVYIQPGARPVVTSTGYVPAPVNVASTGSGNLFMAAATQTAPWDSGQTFLRRTVRAQCRAIGRFTKAIVARDSVDLNGKYVNVDSYHSYDTNGSSSGLYDIAKRRANGDVAVIQGFHDDLNVKAAKVRGKVSTGPDGDLKVDKKAVVGDLAWHDGGNTGVKPGWSSADANFDMPSVTKPFNNGFNPNGGWVGTNYYDVILNDGDYKVSQFDGKVLVQGNARLLVTSKIEFKDGAKDDDGIEFADGARLAIYMEGKEARLVGKKNKKKNPLSERTSFNDGGNATNFFYYGLDKNTKLEMSKMDEFTGIVYAPKAEVIIKAGSIKYYRANFYGSIMGFKVKLEKNANVHYDENIANLMADSYIVESWEEL